MRKYTQKDIDKILSHDDIIDDEHTQAVSDIRLLFWINQRTTNELTIDLDKLNHLYKKLWEGKNRDDIETSLNLAKSLDYLHLTQGVQNFDYERNIWRVAYTLKSVQLSEEEAKQGMQPTNPSDLMANFTKEDFESFEETYEKLKRIYTNNESAIAFLRILKEKVGLEAIQLLIDKYTVDIELMDVIKEEAINAHSKILINLTDENHQDDRSSKSVIFTPKTEQYKPLLAIPDLKKYKLNEQQFINIKSNIEQLSLLELVNSMNQILDTFRGVILDG